MCRAFSSANSQIINIIHPATTLHGHHIIRAPAIIDSALPHEKVAAARSVWHTGRPAQSCSLLRDFIKSENHYACHRQHCKNAQSERTHNAITFTNRIANMHGISQFMRMSR